MRSMPSASLWRALLSASLVLSLVTGVSATSSHAAHGARVATSSMASTSASSQPGGLSPSEVQRLAQNATQHVIIILRHSYPNLPDRGATQTARAQAIATDQSPILAELAQLHAPDVRSFHLVNDIAATISAAEADRLRTNPAVQAVVPDRLIQEAPTLRSESMAATAAQPLDQAGPASVLPTDTVPATCTTPPLLEPEALQLTDTAFTDTAQPQAQAIVTGTGVTVAFLADGVDPTNPDFIRPDGSPVFTQYVDFSGDGATAPTAGGEAFGDASSIAAQGRLEYDVDKFVNSSHQTGQCLPITVRGMAPGAALIGIKAFGQTHQSPTSNFVQAIEYAVDHGANVINESFGSNPYPDNADATPSRRPTMRRWRRASSWWPAAATRATPAPSARPPPTPT